jgi:hypothetical protein
VFSIRRWSANGRLRFITTLAAAVLAAVGGSALGLAVASQYDVPVPAPSAFGSIGHVRTKTPRAHQPKTPIAPTPGARTTGIVLPPATPTSLAIPAIGVLSTIQQLGLNPDGTIEVPQPGPLYNDAGWYHYSPTPGQLGPSIILGHIDSAAEGPSVFYRLGELQPGDEVDVARSDGSVAVFTITGVREYPKTAFPTATVYGNTNFAALRLITCGGNFDPSSGHYLDNVVAFASLTSSHPAH